jgi:hypothetical protein
MLVKLALATLVAVSIGASEKKTARDTPATAWVGAIESRSTGGALTPALDGKFFVARTILKRPSAALFVCSTYPCPAGYYWYYFTDPQCPGNPDTFDAYVEYWNEDDSFAYDVYGGHASYTCGETYKPTTLYSSGVYQNCVNNSPWNCQDLGWTWSNHP